jgi:phosphoglycerol transferase MdoB-like AlkP superfamily enzyme
MSLLLWAKLIILRLFLYRNVDVSGSILDLASVIAIVGLCELIFPGRMKKTALWGLNLLTSLILFAATLYYTHFGNIVTYTSLYGIKQVLQVSSSVKQAMHLETYIYFVDFIIAIVVWLVWKWRKLPNHIMIPYRRTSMVAVVAAALVVSAWSIKVEGQVRNELIKAEKLGFFNYQSSFVLDTWESSRDLKFTDTAQAAEVINKVQSKFPYNQQQEEGEQQPKLFGTQQGKNVIVIQVESLQNFTIGYTVDGQPLTPTLNELVKESYYFNRVFQQIGQGNTSDAEFISNTSLYPVGTIPMSTGYGTRELPSLVKLLKQDGYKTATFHVNDVTFWDRDKLYPGLGFDKYFDKPFYTNDEFNAFGASDEQLFRTGIQQLNVLKDSGSPFYAQFVTASSHHPFAMPEDKKRVNVSSERFKDTQAAEYLETVNYADYAIGQFVEQLKENGLWDNSIVVIYGDHSGLKPQYNDPEEVSNMLGIPYHEYITRFNIPFIVHVPGQTEGETIDQVGGQLDMMPTIANLLGVSLDEAGYVHFGHDLMNIDNNVFGIRYYLPTGSFVNDEVMYIPGADFASGQAFSLKTLQPVEDIAPYKKDYYYTLAIEGLSDEYMKLLPKRPEFMSSK